MIIEIIDVLESSKELQDDLLTYERLAYELNINKNIVKILYANKINKKISKELEEYMIEKYITTQENYLKIQNKISVKYFSEEKYKQCVWRPNFVQKEIVIEKEEK